ncbi:MAG: glycosyl hydrolase family 8 [Nitrospirota bacterium]|nr:glycosyl hydrolase family 8 [Nitrospirota bacterium]MDP2382855.1 glycosyl hydrolase family 8 [Nitrospirota bacterium]
MLPTPFVRHLCNIRVPLNQLTRRLAPTMLLVLCGLILGVSPPLASVTQSQQERSSDRYIHQLDDLSALWSFYKQTYIQHGRVVSLDEQGITTSEGQGYAMLRAVWSNDRTTFNTVWAWTKQHLQVRDDKLFAWKWKGVVLDNNSATDADTDIALALILAARRFDHPPFEREALTIVHSIWDREVIQIGSRAYVTAGNWARDEDYPTIHVAYLAPYAYAIFASIDSHHPWAHAIESSYAILHWLYDEEALPVPPELIYLNRQTGHLTVRHPVTGASSSFSYDAFPIYWRIALDAAWFGRSEGALRQKMLGFFQREWKAQGKFVDHYSLKGLPLSSNEGLPLYSTVHALAFQEQHDLARLLSEKKLAQLEAAALAGKRLPYYFHNWLWFGQALSLSQVRHYDEFLGFLRPFDVVGFSAHFPWELFAVTVMLYLIATWHPVLKFAFLACGLSLCLRYLYWRLFHTLNFMESGGPFISIALWAAEFYAFSTVLLLFIQVGVGWRPQPVRPLEPAQGFAPSVDVFIPIYSESCEILEKTLIGASAMEQAHKRIYVLDDSHRDEVCRLAERFGATYIKGPRQHAKAGNLNHALTQTDGELIVIFDTDHIPVSTFLTETVPFFADPNIGFVQTPHHFYNQDIFQRALGASPRIPNEQDLFNHAIQGGRQGWGGAFFVGSGAVFRRSAIAELNGFNLMSITEDIHTSQHLHARGWKSVFVDKNLAVGLTAENLASYIVQRRRWMLGCLQIFFKDNPLLCRGLSLRHRLGYFASLYYFFFPIARVIFWITPLYFLLFHLHPIFADVSILVAYLLPFMIVLPMISSRLLPGWPRLMWSSLYEGPVSFPLFRSMFDLLLPKNLGFKVTPKGLLSEQRSFDWRSSASLAIATLITLAAIAKGLWEFWYFGIEKDAYFFNLSWASFNLLTLIVGLLMAWEKPQTRTEERIIKPIPFELQAGNLSITGTTHDVSLTGVSWFGISPGPLPPTMDMSLHGRIPFTCQVRLVYHDRLSGPGTKCGLTFHNLSEEHRRRLLLNLYSDPATWEHAQRDRLRSSLLMAGHLLIGLLKHFRPLRLRRRQRPRQWRLRMVQVQIGESEYRMIVRDESASGLGLLMYNRKIPLTTPWLVRNSSGQRTAYRPIYRSRIWGLISQVGLSAAPTTSHL